MPDPLAMNDPVTPTTPPHPVPDPARCTRRTAALRALALLLPTGLTACRTFRPEPTPYEARRPKASSPLWQELEAARGDTWLRVLNAGPEALEWRLRALNSASTSIDLETFLWKPDASGLRVLAHLVAAADRGVRVRLLLDDSFTMHEDLALHDLDEHPNIEVRVYNPFTRRHDNVLMRQLLNLGHFSRLNRRLHNKTLIVDGRVAITGGRNIADEYFGFDPAFNFRDMDLLFSGDAVDQAGQHFDQYWNCQWSVPLTQFLPPPSRPSGLAALRNVVAGRTPASTDLTHEALRTAWLAATRDGLAGEARFVADPPAPDSKSPEKANNATLLGNELIRLIETVRENLVLVTAYLIPTPELEATIGRATARGVRVRILTNSLRSNNHLAADAAYRGHVGTLLDHGVELHEMHTLALDRERYMEAPVETKRLGLHAKLLVADDDLVYVGSCNLDARSLRLNTETGLMVRSPGLNQDLRRLLQPDFDPRNAWEVRRSPDGKTWWRSQGELRDDPPADSGFQRLEDWFLGLLPIDNEL